MSRDGISPRDDLTVTTADCGPGVRFVEVTCMTSSFVGAIVAVNQFAAPVNCTLALNVPSCSPLAPDTATRTASGTVACSTAVKLTDDCAVTICGCASTNSNGPTAVPS